MKRLINLALTTGTAFAVIIASVVPTTYASAYTFTPNNIIDDSTFSNATTMSAIQIDSFLNSFTGSCISTNNGFSAPDPTGYNPTQGFLYGNNVSAGQVIYDAAQAYGLNPQVLLTTVQKEQSLVSGAAGCSTLQYAGAAGYGCPDGGTTYSYSGVNLYSINGVAVTSVSGTCVNTSLKVGFSQQVIRAAWLLKFGEERSEGNVSWAIIKGNWDNSDDPQSCYSGPMTQGTWARCPSGGSAYYDGYTTIDGQPIHMDDGATASLYWYTPHLSGNQNFFNIFTSWFGSTKEIYRYSFENLVATSGSVINASINTDTTQAITIGGSMYVFYNNTSTGTLEYALYSNNSWSRHVLDGPTSSTIGSTQSPIAVHALSVFNFQGQPQVFYVDSTANTLRHAFIASGVFHIETLDGTAGSVLGSTRQLGSAISGFDYGNGRIQLYYYDTGNGSLIHSWWNGQQWATETLDGTAGSVLGSTRQLGSAISGFDYGNGRIQLYYYDTGNKQLIHTWFDNYWHTEIMDGGAASLLGNQINAGGAITSQLLNGNIFVLYYDQENTASSWHIAYTNNGWVNEVLDGGSSFSESRSASNIPISGVSVTQYNGSIQIFYAGENNILRHAWLNN